MKNDAVDEWIEYYDPQNQASYYHNHATGETRWVKPGDEHLYESGSEGSDSGGEEESTSHGNNSNVSSLGLLSYAKTNFRKPKERALKKARSYEERLCWQNEPITKPLHPLSKRLTPEAVKAYSCILYYMGDAQTSEPNLISFAISLCEKALADEALVNEIFCQLCKQTTQNPNQPSLVKGWQLIALLCGCVEPSRQLLPHFQDYLKSNADKQDEIGELAKLSQQRLELTLSIGPRKLQPLKPEIDSIFNKTPLIIRVSFLDDTHTALKINTSLTSREFCNLVKDKKSLKNATNFSLFEYLGSVEIRVLKDDEQILDSLSRWALSDERALKKKEIKPEEVGTRFRFVFKPRLILPSMEDVDDPAFINFLYIHAVFNTLCGNYSCSDDDAIRMAALQLQVSVGDYQVSKNPAGFVSNNLDKYVPTPILTTRSPDDWEKIIVEAYKRLEGRKALDAKLEYLAFVKKSPLYGASFFFVSQKQQFADMPENILVVINHECVQFVRSGMSKGKIAAFPYSEVLSWGYTDSTFSVIVGNQEKQHKIKVETKRGEEMCGLCRGYVDSIIQGISQQS